MMEAMHFSETSVLTRATLLNTPEVGILYSHGSQDLKSYITLIVWTLHWRRNVSPVKYELDLIFEKTTFFIVTAVKTSNLT
jgi:hypothetical protein